MRAGRQHWGPAHWHVRVRTNVIVCRACAASIPKWKNPQFCDSQGIAITFDPRRDRLLDEHRLRSLGKLVVGYLDGIANVDNVVN